MLCTLVREYLDCTGSDVQGLYAEVHSDGWNPCRGEYAIRVASDDTCLADASISDEDNLKQVVVLCFHGSDPAGPITGRTHRDRAHRLE